MPSLFLLLLACWLIACLLQPTHGYSILPLSSLARAATTTAAARRQHRLFAQTEKDTNVRGTTTTVVDKRVEVDTSTKMRDEIERDWRLVLHDDSIHTVPEVSEYIAKFCPLCSPERAYELTMQVHIEGAATIAVTTKKVVDEYSAKLQSVGLTVSVSPDDEFFTTEELGEDET